VLFGIAHNKPAESLRKGRVEASARRELKLERQVIADEDLERVEELSSIGDANLARVMADLSDDQRDARPGAGRRRARLLFEIANTLGARRWSCVNACHRGLARFARRTGGLAMTAHDQLRTELMACVARRGRPATGRGRGRTWASTWGTTAAGRAGPRPRAGAAVLPALACSRQPNGITFRRAGTGAHRRLSSRPGSSAVASAVCCQALSRRQRRHGHVDRDRHPPRSGRVRSCISLGRSRCWAPHMAVDAGRHRGSPTSFAPTWPASSSASRRTRQHDGRDLPARGPRRAVAAASRDLRPARQVTSLRFVTLARPYAVEYNRVIARDARGRNLAAVHRP